MEAVCSCRKVQSNRRRSVDRRHQRRRDLAVGQRSASLICPKFSRQTRSDFLLASRRSRTPATAAAARFIPLIQGRLGCASGSSRFRPARTLPHGAAWASSPSQSRSGRACRWLVYVVRPDAPASRPEPVRVPSRRTRLDVVRVPPPHEFAYRQLRKVGLDRRHSRNGASPN